MQHVSNILIIHQGAIGDFILSLPAISSIRHNYPDASIEIWGYPHILKLVEERFYADMIYSVDQKGMAQFYSESAVLDAKLIERFRQFDFIIIFGQEGSKILLHNLEKIKVKEVYFINTFPQDSKYVHVIDYQMYQLSHLGYETPDKVPKLFPGEEDRKRAADFFQRKQLDDKSLIVAVHIGSGSRMKAWPPGCFAQLCEKLIKRDNARIILPIGPADKEITQEYFKLIDAENIFPINNLPLNDLAAILRKCNVYIGNDSGIAHLAAAVGMPVVALFGPTDPKVWGPRGNVSIVYKATECSPCSRDEMKRCESKRCFEEISVEEVYRRVTNKLEI
jgi:ADP-heptose:LPS heptosyltransferase